MVCAVCQGNTVTNLCDACAAELDVPVPFVLEQILSGAQSPAPMLLVDVWGRVHPLEQQTLIGRQPASRGVSILQASVSRRHATISLVDGVWWLEDLASRNGTRVNDEPVTRMQLSPGDRLCFGAVGMYFVADDGERARDAEALSSPTIQSDDRVRLGRAFSSVDGTSTGLPELEMRLVEAPAGGGGYLEVAGEHLQLSITQYAMLDMLIERMRTQPEVSEVVRGFVPSGQLIADLPWDATKPDESHLKQLVRRLRRTLSTIHLGGMIESRRGFGYRLRVIPR